MGVERMFDQAALLSAARAHPAAAAGPRVLPVPGELGDLLPGGGLARGSTVEVGPATAGGISLALALAARVTAEGWAGVVGLPSLGLAAAAEAGVRLERLALVPDPGERWAAVAGVLAEGMDLLLLGGPRRVRPADARRLSARARERGTILVLLAAGVGGAARTGMVWPETPEIRLTVTGGAWSGLGAGHGGLEGRRMEVRVSGRRAAARERRGTLWLPARRPSVAAPEAPAPLRDPRAAEERAGSPAGDSRASAAPATAGTLAADPLAADPLAAVPLAAVPLAAETLAAETLAAETLAAETLAG